MSPATPESNKDAGKRALSYSPQSWGNNFARTPISTLNLESLSNNTARHEASYGLESVTRVVRDVGLKQYRYEERVREERPGEGVSYLVERCTIEQNVFAVKHVKFDQHDNRSSLRNNLRLVVLEMRIMAHRTLNEHANIIKGLWI